MSRPFAVKGGGACPSMFSTPGFSCLRHSRTRELMPGGKGPAVARSIAERAWLDEGDPIPPYDRALDARGSLDALYRAHRPRLVRFLSRRTGSRDYALDVVQEVFSRLARFGLVRLAGIDRPEAFLRQMAYNLLRDDGRKAVRQRPDLHIVADEEALKGPDQFQLLETRDTLRRLETALLKLKPRTRQIFLAHRLDGMSYAEIAEHMGLSVKGVEKQMSKAIAYIDRTLDRF